MVRVTLYIRVGEQWTGDTHPFHTRKKNNNNKEEEE